MANYTDEKRSEHKELVRQALVAKPRATLKEIQELVEKVINWKFDKNYLLKVVNAVRAERRVRYAHDPEVNNRIAEMEDKINQVQTSMWQIILNPRAADTAKIRAGEVIVRSEKNLIEAQMDSGIFERKLGTVEVEENAGIHQPIINAMFNMGMIQDTMTEAEFVEAAEVKPKQINGPTTTTKKQPTAKRSGGKNEVPQKPRKARA